MRTTGKWLTRQIAGCLVVLLMVPLAEAATGPQQATDGQQPQTAPSQQSQPQASDTSAARPAEATTQAETTYPDNPAPAASQAPDQSPQSGTDQQPNPPQKPLGTAAAPYERTTGVAASRPAGAAIAPAKQRRKRAIVISVAIVVGAAVAVGTVAGLSKGSPSRPH
jgi:hypothetical protein